MSTPTEPDTGSRSAATREDRIETLRRDWLREQSGAAPVRLQPAHVHEIAFRLILAKVQPTMEAIRRVNGGHGSPNTIHPALREFFERGELEKRQVHPSVPSELPDPLRELWQKVLEHTRTVMEGEFAEQRAAAQQVKAEQAAREAELAQRERDLATRTDAQASLVQRLEKDAQTHAATLQRAQAALAASQTQAKQQREGSEHALARQQREIAALNSRETTLQEQMVNLEKTMDATHAALDEVTRARDAAKQESNDLRETLAASEATLLERKAGLAASEHRLQTITATLQSITDSHRTQREQREQAHHQALASLRVEREQARENCVRTASVLAERTEALKQTRAATAAAVAQRNQFQATLVARERRIAELESLLREAHQVAPTDDKPERP